MLLLQAFPSADPRHVLLKPWQATYSSLGDETIEDVAAQRYKLKYLHAYMLT